MSRAAAKAVGWAACSDESPWGCSPPVSGIPGGGQPAGDFLCLSASAAAETHGTFRQYFPDCGSLRMDVAELPGLQGRPADGVAAGDDSGGRRGRNHTGALAAAHFSKHVGITWENMAVFAASGQKIFAFCENFDCIW